jgi:hypothetical protein
MSPKAGCAVPLAFMADFRLGSSYVIAYGAILLLGEPDIFTVVQKSQAQIAQARLFRCWCHCDKLEIGLNLSSFLKVFKSVDEALRCEKRPAVRLLSLFRT